MAHVTLEGKSIVVKCDDGTIINPGVIADKTQLGTLVSQAIDQAIIKADDKHVDEVSKLAGDVAKETSIIRGLLTPVQKKEEKAAESKTALQAQKNAAEPQKRINAPVQPLSKENATPTRREVDGKWLEARLDETAGGGLKPIDAIYGNRNELDKGFPEHQEAATRIVFAALSKIPAFMLNLNAMAQNNEAGYPAFKRLNDYLKTGQGLKGTSQDVITAANVYMRFFLFDLQAQTNGAYMQELSQLPKCKSTMDELQKSLPKLKPLDYPMESGTTIAAALYVRRWNLEQRGSKPEQIPGWQSPETLAAVKAAPVSIIAPPIRIKEQLDTTKFEIKW